MMVKEGLTMSKDTAFLGARIPKALKEKLDKRAADERRPIVTQLIMILEKALND